MAVQEYIRFTQRLFDTLGILDLGWIDGWAFNWKLNREELIKINKMLESLEHLLFLACVLL